MIRITDSTKYLLFIVILISISVAFSKGEMDLPKDKIVISNAENEYFKENTAINSSDIIYFFLLDRFVDGDIKNNNNVNKEDLYSYHGGDLKGLNENMSYFDGLSMTTLITTPLVDNRNTPFFGQWALHGYWPIDFFQVDEHFGSWYDIGKFLKTRKEKNKKYIVDLVLNHVDWDHPWVKAHPEWFHNKGDIVNWNDSVQLVTHNITGLPDLKQEDPQVEQKLIEYSLLWLDRMQPEGVRFDAVKHIDHSFWKTYLSKIKIKMASYLETVSDKTVSDETGGESLKKNQSPLLLAEVLHGDPQHYKPYIEDGFNSFYDYPLYYTIKEVFAENKSMMKLASRLQEEFLVFPNPNGLVTFLDNHDMPRFLDLSSSVTFEDLKQAWTFLVTVRGIPLFYSGTEQLIRGKTGEEGRKSLVDIRSEMESKGWISYLRKVNALRSSMISLQNGFHQDWLVQNDLYAFLRTAPKEETLMVFYRGKEPKRIKIPLAHTGFSLLPSEEIIVDRLLQRTAIINEEKLEFNISSKEALMFVHQLPDEKLYAQRLKMNKADIQVVFKIQHLTKNKSNLYLVGNRKEIGSWDPQKAIGPFKKTKVGFEINHNFPRGEGVLEYKLIKKTGKKVQWQSGENNYVFLRNKREAVVIESSKISFE